VSTWDAIVIGAGYIGCSISYYLSRAGLRVLLLDQGGIGVGASSANYGNIQVQDAELEYSLPMVLAGKACFNTLSEELESDLELRTLGCLLIAEKEYHIAALKDRAVKLRAAGVEAAWLNRDELHKVEPNLAVEQTFGALFNPDEMQLNPFKLMWAFVYQAQKQGCVVQTNSPVRGFILENGRLLGVQTDQGQQYAAVTILATGAWSKQLGKQLGIHIPVSHVHGQAAVIGFVGPILRNYLSSAAFFEEAHSDEGHARLSATLAIAPTAHGNLLLGEASEVVDHFSQESSPEGIRAISQVALRYLPALGSANILRSWGAPAAFTADGRPYLGPVDDLEGLFLAVAFKSTVVITPLIGRVITQLIMEGQTELDIRPYLLSRTAPPPR
jgi:sarcosine oxidase subunit beta